MKTLFFLAVTFALALPLVAGDGNPFPPYQVVIRFDSKNPQSTAKYANVVMDIKWPNDGKMHVLDGSHFNWISIQTGDLRLDLPPSIVRDLRDVDFSSVRLEWGLYQYHLSFHGTIGDKTGVIGFAFVAKDRKNYVLRAAGIDQTDLSKIYPDALRPSNKMPLKPPQ